MSGVIKFKRHMPSSLMLMPPSVRLTRTLPDGWDLPTLADEAMYGSTTFPLRSLEVFAAH
ncbi:hypothetical protein N7523_003344 [Penicillium sp. IBT 18751x]|nr:hypothetical protein N7523_003344 [Penicillium sp. IBT 18751x]